MQDLFQVFSGLYPVTRTLSFQLKPMGRTNEFIQNRGLITEDEERAAQYKKVKKIIDRRHKQFIDDVLGSFQFKSEDLRRYSELYGQKKEKGEKRPFDKLRKDMRKDVSKALKSHPDYKALNGKTLIKSELESVIQGEEEKKLVHSFDQWTTYFNGFNENRENMYTDEGKSTEIGFRIVEQNLPKFLDNVNRVYQKCIETDPDIFRNIDPVLLEENGFSSLDELFTPEAYNHFLTQKAIDSYNELLGGYSAGDRQKTQGLNEIINLYNQQHKTRLPEFTNLFKQILSDRVQGLSDLPEAIESDQELLDEISQYWNQLQDTFCGPIPELLSDLQDYDPNGIFIANDTVLTEIIQQIYGLWDKFKNAWLEQYELVTPRGKRTSPEGYYEKAEKEYKQCKSFSIAEIREVLAGIHTDEPVQDILSYFKAASIPDGNGGTGCLLQQVDSAYKAVESLLKTSYPSDKNLLHDKEAVAGLKRFLDSIKDTQHFFRMLAGTGKEPGKDMAFYSKLNMIIAALDPVTPLYNRVRNYLCQKPYSTEKFKLNFDCVTLLDGWDANKEKDNLGILFQKDNFYYLGILRKGCKIVFQSTGQTAGQKYRKIVYKLLPNPNKMLPKVFFSDKRIKEFAPSDEVMKCYKAHRDDNVPYSPETSKCMIRFYQESIARHEDWKNFGFQYSPKANEDLKQFFKETEQQGYSIRFEDISADYIDSLVEKGDLYLFQIWNKDFSKFSKGTPNMHTLYWKALFDPKNLADIVFKLNGEAEIFYRKASIPAGKPTHPAGIPITLRRNKSDSRTFAYDLIKDKRFTYDQFSFHVKININFKSDSEMNANSLVRSWLMQTDNPHIIGIDRGERNLIYVTVIDSSGKIKYQKSLNEITGKLKSDCETKEITTDYHALLGIREKDNDKAQKSWQTIEKIKDLKAGYLSQVIHELTKLVLKYNAVICLEDLSSGFIRGRQKVDKSVYQQFERDLIRKLQYLADKTLPVDQPLGILHGLQLVNSDVSFKGPQNGILFYIPAWCTSKIDPVTGFINLFGSRWLQWENIGKAKSFFAKFKEICYDPKADLFEFTFDYKDFTEKAEGTRTLWTVCSYGERLESFRNPEKQNHWDCRTLNLTKEFKDLFANYGIDCSGELKQQIMAQPETKGFWCRLLYLFKLVVQLRNSKSGSLAAEDDYILSPVRDRKGVFFDTRTADSSLPGNADANGAYNIARKGLWCIRKIKGSADPMNEKLTMNQKDWLNFVQPE